jgi:hypothetical protein
MSTATFRPQLEKLEERSVPGSLFSFGADSDAEALFRLANVAGGNVPNFLPVQSNAFGQTYGEWSASWWQYAYSVPANKTPFLDGTGADFAANQSGKVWFLAGSFQSIDPLTGQVVQGTGTEAHPAVAVRDVTLPTGKALFFPILNSEWDNLNPAGGPDTNFTVDQLRGFAKANADAATGMSLDVDNVHLDNAFIKANFRVTSPVFSYTLPDNNIVGVPPRSVSPAVGDGYYVMLAPLSAGDHTIHFTGTVPAASGQAGPDGFGLDVTYHVHVQGGK